MSIEPNDLMKLIDPSVQNKVYDDLFSPSIKEMGDALQSVVRFVKTPFYLIKLCNKYTQLRFEKSMHLLQKKFDEVEESEKAKLNEAIQSLSDGSISYEEFYRIVNQEDDRRYEFHRSKISGSRKFSYRKEQQKVDRIKRHK